MYLTGPTFITATAAEIDRKQGKETGNTHRGRLATGGTRTCACGPLLHGSVCFLWTVQHAVPVKGLDTLMGEMLACVIKLAMAYSTASGRRTDG